MSVEWVKIMSLQRRLKRSKGRKGEGLEGEGEGRREAELSLWRFTYGIHEI